MAKVTAPLMSMDASGSLGKALVFAKWKGINYVRRYVVPMNPNTENQEKIRSYFVQAINSWQAETQETKALWNAAVRGRPLTGLNYYLSRYVKYLLDHGGQAPPTPFLPPGQEQA